MNTVQKGHGISNSNLNWLAKSHVDAEMQFLMHKHDYDVITQLVNVQNMMAFTVVNVFHFFSNLPR